MLAAGIAPCAGTHSSQRSPAAQAQLRLLEEIVSSGNGSKKLGDAVKKLAKTDDDKSATTTTTTTNLKSLSSAPSSSPPPSSPALRALRSLPVTGYEPEFAEACSRAIDALRSIRDSGGGGSVEGEKVEEYKRALSDLFADASRVDVRGFGLTSGTSGAARKVFPQTAEAVRRRNAVFPIRPPLVAAGEARLNLFVPARPEVLCSTSLLSSCFDGGASSSSSTSNGGKEKSDTSDDGGADRITQGPVTAILFNPWIRKLEGILDGGDGGDGGGEGESTGVDPATDVDPIRGGERQSYPLAVAVAEGGIDVEQRLYLMWLCTLARGGARVRLVSDTFGGSTLNAVRVLRSFGEEIARDLRAGKLSDDFFSRTEEENEEEGAEEGEKKKKKKQQQQQEKLRRAVDLYIGAPRPSEAQQLEEALASEAKGCGDNGEEEEEEEGLLAKLLPNVRFVSAIFTGSMSKYLGPMRSLLRRRRRRRRRSSDEGEGAAAEDDDDDSDDDAAIITEFYGGSEGTYGVNEARLSRPECFLAPRRGEAEETTTTSTTKEKSKKLTLPEPQRFVAMTGADAFLEFLPLDDDDGKDSSSSSSAPKQQPLSIVDGEIPINKCYELVVTNFMGLARYRVGDVVRVVGAFEPPPRPAEAEVEGSEDSRRFEEMRGAPVFEFVGRAGSALNLVWEKYDEGALLAAVADAAAALASGSASSSSSSSSSQLPPWKDFAAREDVGRGGEKDRYVIYLEPASSSSSSSSTEKDYKAWADALEQSLRAHNDVYRMLTTRGQISPLRVSIVSAGAFDALRDAAVASGTAHAQYKAPVVVEADAKNGKRTKLLESKVVALATARVDASE